MKRDWRSRLQGALGLRAEEDGASTEPLALARPAVGQDAVIVQIPLADIVDNPRQPRLDVDPEGIRDLAESIAQHGVLQPLLVRKVAGGYELIAGRRRLHASGLAGLDRVPALVVDVSDADSGLLALIENLQREDLGFLEEAVAYDRLLKEFSLTQEELARQLGKSQSSVANKVRLLRLPDEVKLRLKPPVVSERHARALLGLRDARNQMRVVDAVVDRGLTVRQTESMVEKLRAEEQSAVSVQRPAPNRAWRGVFRDVRILSNTFKAAVVRLREAGVDAELEEVQRDEGLEIKVLVRLPEGWREGTRRDMSPEASPAKPGSGNGDRDAARSRR